MDIDRHISKAEEAIQRKNPDYAIGICRQILGIDLGNANARRCLRSASLLKNKNSGGLATQVKILPALLQLGILTKLKKREAILKTCDKILTAAPNHTKTNILAGQTALSLGLDDAAIQIYEGLGKDGGGDASALKALGHLYRQKGDIQKALESYEGALKLDPRDHEAQRARKNLAAEEALTHKGYESAKSSRDLMKDKEGARALEQKARIARTPEEIAASIEQLESKAGDGSSSPRSVLELADLHVKRDDYAKAVEIVEEGAKKHPNDPELLNRLGDLTVLEMDHEIGKIKGEADGDPGKKEKLLRLQSRKASYEVSEYGRRVKLYPTDLGLRHRHARALQTTGQVDEAIAEYQKAINDPKSRIEALTGLGTCFARKKMFDLAAKQFGLAIEGSSETDRRTLGLRYRLGLVFEEQEDYKSALSEYGKIFERDINFRDVAGKVEAMKKLCS